MTFRSGLHNTLVVLLLLIAAFPFLDTAILNPASAQDDSFAIFDGKSLEGWEGDNELWRVDNGVLVGETTAALEKTTYLIWRQGTVDDFELTLSYRITGGNSGIQYRSQDRGEFRVTGYQADMEAGNNHSGILYEQGGRGIVTKRGERTTLHDDGVRKHGSPIGTSENLQSVIKSGDWNQYRIIARGNHLQHFINGTLMSETTDNEGGKQSLSGILAFQLHAGPPMKVEFKDIHLKRLRLTD
ncbi:MAG: DUF1080 domain-containing protein, partial [Pirellulales bacterium]